MTNFPPFQLRLPISLEPSRIRPARLRQSPDSAKAQSGLCLQAMQLWLTYALYAVIGVVFVVLAFGVFNLVRTDDQARSRSNKLMRLRVVVQFVAIILVVAIGLLAGAFR